MCIVVLNARSAFAGFKSHFQYQEEGLVAIFPVYNGV
jgi:hypothetical protein